MGKEKDIPGPNEADVDTNTDYRKSNLRSNEIMQDVLPSVAFSFIEIEFFAFTREKP